MLTRLVKRFYRWRKWHWWENAFDQSTMITKNGVFEQVQRCETCKAKRGRLLYAFMCSDWALLEEGNGECN